jgi:hypothetical protein
MELGLEITVINVSTISMELLAISSVNHLLTAHPKDCVHPMEVVCVTMILVVIHKVSIVKHVKWIGMVILVIT